MQKIVSTILPVAAAKKPNFPISQGKRKNIGRVGAIKNNV